MASSRLVTIVGPGGVGKTTVAVAVAHDLADAFAGSVLFASIKDEENSFSLQKGQSGPGVALTGGGLWALKGRY